MVPPGMHVLDLGAGTYADAGQRVRLAFEYRPGDEIHVLAGSVRAT